MKIITQVLQETMSQADPGLCLIIACLGIAIIACLVVAY